MEIKKDILWRVYVCFLGMMVLSGFIIAKAIVIQDAQGNYWRSMSDSLHTRYMTIDANRGTIFSSNGRMLSTSIPNFDIHLDLGADGIREHNGKVFKDNVDSLSLCLANLFKDKSRGQYERMLKTAYHNDDRYFLLKRAITFEQYQQLREFPMFRLGRNKGGIIAETKDKRINPFQLLANRTIGLSRPNAPNVGLEATYNKYLKGVTGKRLMRRIAGGTYIPVEGYEIDPENGKDVISNIDVNIQDIAENALYKMVSGNEATHGTCIVMEVKTGKIKAIANLGRQPDGSYWEDYNYGVGMSTEPGSVFKLALMISLLQDKYVTLDDSVDIGNGTYRYGNRTMYDAESHYQGKVSVAQAFEISSNVGMSKLAYRYYAKNPYQYLHHLHELKLDTLAGIDLLGESKPLIKNPKSRTWSATTLPWMSVGYEVLESPLKILTLYNAVANNGKMMKPYLVSDIQEYGQEVKHIDPTVLINKICSDTTLTQLHKILEGVVERGTAHGIRSPLYKMAGKTGTALVANGSHGYADKIYQSTFVGYFPADHPLYSCIVVIKNKPHALHYYGASVAAPVFKEVADRLYAMHMEKQLPQQDKPAFDSLLMVNNSNSNDLEKILSTLNINYNAPKESSVWAASSTQSDKVKLDALKETNSGVPDVKGMGLKDALYLLENVGLHVNFNGTGRVSSQSMAPGTKAARGATIIISLS